MLSLGHLYFTMAFHSICVTRPPGIAWHLKADELRGLETVLHFQTEGYILNLVNSKAVIYTRKTTAATGILRKWTKNFLHVVAPPAITTLQH